LLYYYPLKEKSPTQNFSFEITQQLNCNNSSSALVIQSPFIK
jgi:hypothetical protein